MTVRFILCGFYCDSANHVRRKNRKRLLFQTALVHADMACQTVVVVLIIIFAAERSDGSHLFLTTFTVFTRARSPRDLCILAKAFEICLSFVRSFVRSFGSHFLTSQNLNLYKFTYAGSLRWQSDHFRKLRSVRRSFIGAMTFNFDITRKRIIFLKVC